VGGISNFAEITITQLLLCQNSIIQLEHPILLINRIEDIIETL